MRTHVSIGRTGVRDAEVHTMSYLERVMRYLSVIPFPVGCFSISCIVYEIFENIPIIAEVKLIGSNPFWTRNAF